MPCAPLLALAVAAGGAAPQERDDHMVGVPPQQVMAAHRRGPQRDATAMSATMRKSSHAIMMPWSDAPMPPLPAEPAPLRPLSPGASGAAPRPVPAGGPPGG